MEIVKALFITVISEIYFLAQSQLFLSLKSSELGKNNQWSVIGITSFGVKCGDSRFPGVYTRVDQYLDWIRRNTQSRRTAIQFQTKTQL